MVERNKHKKKNVNYRTSMSPAHLQVNNRYPVSASNQQYEREGRKSRKSWKSSKNSRAEIGVDSAGKSSSNKHSRRISLTKKLANQSNGALHQIRASYTESKLSDEQDLNLDGSIMQPKNKPIEQILQQITQEEKETQEDI